VGAVVGVPVAVGVEEALGVGVGADVALAVGVAVVVAVMVGDGVAHGEGGCVGVAVAGRVVWSGTRVGFPGPHPARPIKATHVHKVIKSLSGFTGTTQSLVSPKDSPGIVGCQSDEQSGKNGYSLVTEGACSTRV
jgi:hypothetical protein